LKLESATALTDGQLLARFNATGEQLAFEELVRRHGSMVLRVCRRILSHTQDAEDAFQAAFLVLARKAGAVAEMQSVGGWLHGVTYRTALNAKKRRGRRPVDQRLPADGACQDTDTDTLGQELRLALDQALDHLPEKYRAAVVLCYLEGKTNEEAACLLGCQTGAIEMRLTRGRNMLRSRLERQVVAMSAAALATLLAEEAYAMALPVSLVTPVVQMAKGLGAGQTAGAISPAVGSLAEAV